jgi:pimeloyl-ACP methyl ester carboxylesterase
MAMMSLPLKILSLLAASALATAAAGATVPSALTADPVPDVAHPARMASIVMPSHGSTMNAVLYIASGAGPHPSLVLLHGFPGNEQNLDVVQAARRAGWNVLTLHYRGSWGSQGDFSYAHCIEDGQVALDWMRSPANAAKYGIDPARIVMGGHSLGGFVAVKTAAANKGLLGVLLIDAWDIGYDVAKISSPDTRGKIIAASAPYMPAVAGTTAAQLIDESIAHVDTWKLAADAPALATQPLFDAGTTRGDGPANAALVEAVRKIPGSRVTATMSTTDHYFSDHRIFLTTAVVNWLATFN